MNESGVISVRGVKIGTGIPKICVPVMGKTEADVFHSAAEARICQPDLIEWRMDFLEGLTPERAEKILPCLREQFPQTPILATCRTAAEGGKCSIAREDYVSLTEQIIASGFIDLADIEVQTCGESCTLALTRYSRLRGVIAVGSRHDFTATPSKAELIAQMERMAELDCDMVKLAVMPQCPEDVLALLSATAEMKNRHPSVPLITMSMGCLGAVSRLCGEEFGSAVTFGSAGQASAPGQLDVGTLRRTLIALHA